MQHDDTQALPEQRRQRNSATRTALIQVYPGTKRVRGAAAMA